MKKQADEHKASPSQRPTQGNNNEQACKSVADVKHAARAHRGKAKRRNQSHASFAWVVEKHRPAKARVVRARTELNPPRLSNSLCGSVGLLALPKEACCLGQRGH